MIVRRFATGLCAIMLFLCAVSCSPSGGGDKGDGSVSQNTDTVQAVNLTLPYSSKDVLNPYTAKTKQNQELAHLLFDPLVKASDSFEPVLYLAKSVKQDGMQVHVTIRSALFTDGTPVTAADVAYSIRQGQSDGSNYNSKLKNIASVTVTDTDSLVLSLSHEDPYFSVNLDFPIIKSDSANLKNENNLSVPPIGCGRYTLCENDGTYALKANTKYYRGTIRQTEISLVNCPDSDALSHYLSIGSINLIHSDLSDATIPKLSGSTSKTLSSSLVFLGVNSSVLSVQMRQVLSFSLDRTALCEGSYFDYAQPATSLFHPNWAAIHGLKSIDESPNDELAVAYLEELGYNKLDEDGYRTDKDGKRLSFRLLYNEENTSRAAAANQIAIQAKRYGIEIVPTEEPFDRYKQALSNWDFDLYLGEIRLSNSMDAYPLLSEVSAVYGVSASSAAKEAYRAYCAGELDLLGMISSFVSDMPFVPLCYRNGVILSDKAVMSSLDYSVSDVYNGIELLKN